MTVHSLETARAIVEEIPGEVVAVYRYTHVISGDTLWSVETSSSAGATLSSEYVVGPVLVYDGRGWLP